MCSCPLGVRYTTAGRDTTDSAFWVLIADVLYEVAIQLTVIWYAAQPYTWAMILACSCFGTHLDLLVTIVESFMFLVVRRYP